MAEMVDSVKQNGVLRCALVRLKADGGYENGRRSQAKVRQRWRESLNALHRPQSPMMKRRSSWWTVTCKAGNDLAV